MSESSPEKMEAVTYAQQRNSQRREKIVDQHLIKARMGGAGEALVIDLSDTGMGVQLMIPIQPGSKLTVDFDLPGNCGHVRADAQVVWSNAARRAGIRFLRMSDPTRERLKRWLDPLRATAAANLRAGNGGPATAPRGSAEFADLLDQIRIHKLDVNSALALVVERASALTAATGAAIATGPPDAAICRASLGDAPDVGAPIRSNTGLTADCFRTRQTVRCDDAQSDHRLDPQVCKQLNLRSAVLVPLFSDDHGQHLAGVLEVFSAKPRAFTDEHIVKLATLAEIAASVTFGTALPSGADAPLGTTQELDLTDALQSVAAGGGSNATESVTLISEEELERLLNPFISGLELSSPPQKPAPPKAAPADELGDDVLALEQPKQVVTARPAPAPPAASTPPAPRPPETRIKPAAPLAPASRPEVKTEVSKKPDHPLSKPAFDPRASAGSKSALFPRVNRETPAPAPPKATPPKPSLPSKPAAVAAAPSNEKGKEKDGSSLEFKPIETSMRETGLVAMADAVSIAQPAAAVDKASFAAESTWVPSLASESSSGNPLRWVVAGVVLIAIAGAAWFFAGRAAKPAPQVESRTVLGPPMTPPEIPVPTPAAAVHTPAATPAVSAAAGVSPSPASSSSQSSPAPATSTPSPSKAPAAHLVTSGPAQPAPSVTPAGGSSSTPKGLAPVDSKASAPMGENSSAMVREVEPNRPSTSVHTIAVPNSKTPAPEAAPPLAPEPVPQTTAIAALSLPSTAAQPSLAQARHSEGLTGGAIVYRVEPRYPAMAKATRLEGVVVLNALVRTDGTVEKVQRISGNPVLAEAAIEAVKQWRYEPFKLNGVVTATETTVRVKFARPE